MTIKETSLHALERITVSMDEADKMLAHTPAGFVFLDVYRLYEELRKTTPFKPKDGERIRMVEIIAKVWLAGRLQGIRSERARRKSATFGKTVKATSVIKEPYSP